jgi:hypothetical protein
MVVDGEARLAVADGLTDTLQLRGMIAGVQSALIGESTQRVWFLTQEADNGDGGPKSGAEPGPWCWGSAEPARRWRGSGPECFCGERWPCAWKREEGHSVASRAKAGRGRKREWGVRGRCHVEGGKWEGERGPGVSVGSMRQINALGNDPRPSGVGGPVVAEQGRAAGRGRRGAARLTSRAG